MNQPTVHTHALNGMAALLVALLLLVSACSGGESGEDAADDTPAESETTGGEAGEDVTADGNQPVDGGSLRVGMSLLPLSGVPWVTVGSPGSYVWGQVMDALTYVDNAGSVVPALAESWETVDETTWRFTLRDGVTFSNDEPLDADAVVATFDTLLSEEGRAAYSAHVQNYGFVSDVTAVDDKTVEVVTDEPNPLLPAILSTVYIVPPAYWEEVGADGFATAPVGTGPFVVDDWGTSEIAMSARESESWRPEPKLDTLTFVSLEDQAARLQALQSEQVDLVQSISPDQVGTLEDSGFETFVADRGELIALQLINNEGGPLEDPRVRQAMNYAVDKEAISDQLLGGIADPGVWPVEGVNGYDPSREPYPYDPERARELLEEAGYADGFDIVAQVTTGSSPNDEQMWQAMAGYLGDVGINVELRQIDFGSWIANFLGTDGADWEGDAFASSWRAAPQLDAIRPFTFNSCGWVNEVYCDEDAEEMIAEVNSTFEEQPRNEALAELLDHTREVPPSLFLVENVELWGLRPGVTDFNSSNYNIRFEDVAVSDL